MKNTELEATRLGYSLGERDAIANILAHYKDKVKLPELAEKYSNGYEKHFSHAWHTSK